MLGIVSLLRFSKQSFRSVKIPVVAQKFRSYHSTIKIQVCLPSLILLVFRKSSVIYLIFYTIFLSLHIYISRIQPQTSYHSAADKTKNIFNAISCGDIDYLKDACKSGADINCRNEVSHLCFSYYLYILLIFVFLILFHDSRATLLHWCSQYSLISIMSSISLSAT